MTPKQPLKKSSLLRRCRHWKRPSDARLPFTYLALGVRGLLYIGITARCRHLGIGCLRIIAMLFICTRIWLRVLKGNVFHHGKRIRMMGRRQPGHLRLESPRIHCQGAVENAGRDGSGDGSAMLAALNH